MIDKDNEKEGNFFPEGRSIAKCEFEQDLFNHYILGQEEVDTVDPDWIQLIVAENDVPNAKLYVSDGYLAFYNLRTQEYLPVGQHSLVKLAQDVEFISAEFLPRVRETIIAEGAIHED